MRSCSRLCQLGALLRGLLNRHSLQEFSTSLSTQERDGLEHQVGATAGPWRLERYEILVHVSRSWANAGHAAVNSPHPYMDLATLANFMNLAEVDALELLAAQERATIDDTERQVFLAMRDLCRITYGALFMRLIPDLTTMAFASGADTPTLKDCYAALAAGSLSPIAASGYAMLGAAMFKQCE